MGLVAIILDALSNTLLLGRKFRKQQAITLFLSLSSTSSHAFSLLTSSSLFLQYSRKTSKNKSNPVIYNCVKVKMSETPKLFVNKPKKAQLKPSKTMSAQSSSSSSTTASSSSMGGGNGGASKPPEVPKESFIRRYKFFLPLILSVNLAVGAYLFMRTKKKDVAVEEETTDASTATAPIPTPTTTPPITAATPTTNVVTESLPVQQHARVREPIPEQQQRELFKWMLEEKRKIKPKDPEEKKRIDEEKAILKQFLRSKSIPSI